MGHKLKEKTSVLVIGALGVVFGDIGTSPLYTIKICFIGPHALSPSPENIMGVLSMIFWSLNLVVSIKYALFIMRADDGGQGGIFAMLALPTKNSGPIWGGVWFLAGSSVLPCFMATVLSRRLFPSYPPLKVWKWPPPRLDHL